MSTERQLNDFLNSCFLNGITLVPSDNSDWLKSLTRKERNESSLSLSYKRCDHARSR